MEYFSAKLGIQVEVTISRDRKGQKKGFGHLKVRSILDVEVTLSAEHKIFGKMVSLPTVIFMIALPRHSSSSSLSLMSLAWSQLTQLSSVSKK